jgi:uncharacterized protein (TIGR03545 family)
MTNSTEATKVQKAPGPIRTGALVPTLIFFVLSYAYFHLFFDNHLRKGVEWTAGYVHGAQVDVASITTSFFGGSFRMQGLEITDKEKPTQNLFSVGDIRFGFSWDALLRLKFVVNEAAIENIQALAPRNRPGWVRPPEPPSGKPSAVEQIEKNALNQAESQFSGQILGDIAQILGGTDEKEVLKNIQGQLKAEQFIDDLKGSLKEKEKFWREKIENLPKKEEFEALNKRAKELKFDTKNPSQFAKDLKELKKIVKEADTKIDEVKNAGDGFKTDTEKLKGELSQVDDLIKKDIADIEGRLKIGKINFADFSKDLFGRMFAQKIASVQKYATVAKQYMPPPKDPNREADKIVPPARGQGENIRFPVTGGYPLFWLKKAIISSKATDAGFSGDLSGEITDVSTDPQIVPRPMVFKLAGDFPKQQINGLNILATLDHRTEKATQDLLIKIASYPVVDFSLAKDSDIQLALSKASGALNFTGRLEGGQFAIQAKNEFSQLAYNVEAKSKVLDEAITSILNDIPMIDVNASAAGTWSKFDLNINSNLGREMGRGLERYVKAKIDEMKTKIREQIDLRIKDKRAELDENFNKMRGQVDKVLQDKRAAVEKEKDNIEKSNSGSASASPKDQAKDKLKEKGKDLLKKLKF